MTILVCGASGLVGKELCCLLGKQNINFVGTYNTNIIDKPNMFKLNFSNPTDVEEFLLRHKITYCVFCIVERLTDVCEKDWNSIKNTNIDLVHSTSYLCNKFNIKFIHLSTDYVFDGFKQPNYPDDLKNPLQNYGISKLISEYRVIKNCSNYCIIRTPVLYSTLSKLHDNAVCLIGKNIMDLRVRVRDRNNLIKIKEDNYSIRRPLFIPDLCKFILECFTMNYRGIYHFYNPYNKYTKYEICKSVGSILEIDSSHIIPNNDKSEGIAQRPYDTQLNENKFDITSYGFTNFDDSLRLCFSKFKQPKLTLNNKHSFFYMIDLDGTIINSNMAHYNAYKKIFNRYDKIFIDIDEWNSIILNGNIDNYLINVFGVDVLKSIKDEKIKDLVDETIIFTKNSDVFIHFLLKNNINFCIVTNTSKKTVDLFKNKLPLLNDIHNWIYREDYMLPKPDGSCYELAKNKFYKGEEFIIGIEDSFVGVCALKSVTELIYIYENEDVFKKNDCYLFDDYNMLI
jgi:dTDP-4-dehydrorhamnose reductase